MILIVAALLRNCRENRYVDRAFYGLRPASTGLIGAACVSVVLEVLTNIVVASPETGLFNQFQLGTAAWRASSAGRPDPGGGAAALTNWVKPTKNLHPIVFIAASAVVGVVFASRGYEDRPARTCMPCCRRGISPMRRRRTRRYGAWRSSRTCRGRSGS